MKVKVGDKVSYHLWGDTGNRTATIQGIEICKEGRKNGRPVSKCDISKHHGVVDLSDGHWCYFYQVKEVLS